VLLDLFFCHIRQASMGVAPVASPIGFPDICNDRFGMLVLSLQGRDECVLSLDRENLGACFTSFENKRSASMGPRGKSPASALLAKPEERKMPLGKPVIRERGND
jgi:hypothetical protein